jgi:hypothetical protein
MTMTNVSRKDLAQYMVGKPFQYNEWVGYYREYKEQPTKVVAEITNQLTGKHTIWIFKAEVAFKDYQEYLTKRNIS